MRGGENRGGWWSAPWPKTEEGEGGGFISTGGWGGLEEEAGPGARDVRRGAASPAALQAVAHGNLTLARRAAGERDAAGGLGRSYSVFCFLKK
jgi:hypothetical protein